MAAAGGARPGEGDRDVIAVNVGGTRQGPLYRTLRAADLEEPLRITNTGDR